MTCSFHEHLFNSMEYIVRAQDVSFVHAPDSNAYSFLSIPTKYLGLTYLPLLDHRCNLNFSGLVEVALTRCFRETDHFHVAIFQL